jgi:hypothetical protein
VRLHYHSYRERRDFFEALVEESLPR